MNTSLTNKKVINPKEFYDIQINQGKIQSLYNAFTQKQLSAWQQDLSKYPLTLSQYQQQMQQVNADAGYYEVKAPIFGIIQGINTRYAGGLLPAIEILCNISPEEAIIGKCYVPTKDIGLLKKGRSACYRLEALNKIILAHSQKRLSALTMILLR